MLNDLNWFQELLQARNKFSYGFNAIRGEAILAGLNSAIQVMRPLFKSAIYVNASSDRLRTATRGSERSLPVTEKKRWTSGQKLFIEARSRGEELPLIFAHYAPLTFWAVAREITCHEFTTEYQFADLCPLNGYRRRDLVVESTGAPLPDEFIRSYALVRTPDFVSNEEEVEAAVPSLAPLIEGTAISITITAYERNPRAREKCIKHYGTSCFACGFSFGDTYGKSVTGCIHVHHLDPVAARGGEHVVDPIEDLRPVCPNCHAVLHLRKPPLSIKELKAMLDNA